MLLSIIGDDKNIIPYRKELREVFGSVTATILAQQLMYWHKKMKGKPYYKFIAPPPKGHDKYVEGESWTEELGFSRREFDTALKKIEDLGACRHKSDANNLTWWLMDEKRMNQLLYPVYASVDTEKQPFHKSSNAISQNVKRHLTNEETQVFNNMSNTSIQETTSENTTDINSCPKDGRDSSYKTGENFSVHREVVSFLNKTLGKTYQYSKSTMTPINARLGEGFTIDNFKFVIENKAEQWNHEPKPGQKDMRIYLRPSTLFGTSFESYLNEPDIRKNKPVTSSDLLEKVKDADSKVLELNGLKANEFKAKLVKFSKEEAAYLILTEQLHAVWYDFFFGGPSNPNIEIFKAMAIALGIDYNRGNNASSDIATDCEVIESNSCTN